MPQDPAQFDQHSSRYIDTINRLIAFATLSLILTPISFLHHQHPAVASQGQAVIEWVQFSSIYAVNLVVVVWVSALEADRAGLPRWIAPSIFSVAAPLVNVIPFQIGIPKRRHEDSLWPYVIQLRCT